MAATSPIAAIAEPDGAEEKLLEQNQVLVMPRQDEALLSAKSSKKVQLPAEEVGAGVGGGRFTIGPAPERDWEMVPPDGKWGWLVLVGATVVNILIPGTIKSFGVLLVEFNDVFHSSPAASSGIVALCYFLYSSLGPLSSILSVKWSYKTVTLIGGSFAAFGMIFSSWAFNISYLYFSFGAMVGTGAGLAFPPTVYIVTSYFSRRRGLANGICMSGSALGSIVLPPVLRHLLEAYSYRGAVLILGGLMLNVWAAALLFQPVEEHLVRRYKEPDEAEEGGQDDILIEEDEEMESDPRMNMKTIEENQNGDAQNKTVTSTPSSVQLRQNLSKRKLSYTRPINKSTYSSNSIHSDIRKLGSTETFGRKLSYAGNRMSRNISTSSFAYVSTPFHGSTLSAFERPNEFASQFSLKSIGESVQEVVFCGCCKKKKNAEKSKFFDITLLKEPTYLIILLSSSTVAISYTNFIILLPSHAQNIGLDKDRGALLLSTVSALDLVGRIGGSALSDLNLIPKTFYFVGGLVFSGLSLVCIPFLESYLAISCFSAFFGLASGINTGVTTLVMAEILGVDRLMSTYGISLFVNGVLQLIGPIICGYWFEYSKNFLEPFAEEDCDIEELQPKFILTADEPKSNGSPNHFVKSASAVQVSSVKSEERVRNSTPGASKLKTNLHSNQSLILESLPEGKTSRVNSQEAFGKKLIVPKTTKRSPSTSSFQYMSTPFHGSTLSAFEKPSEFASQFSLKSVPESLAPITYCCGGKKKKKEVKEKEPSKYFDVNLLSDPIYLVILISNCTCAISYTNFIILVPSYAQECGFDKSLGAYLLSIISALDLVGRIGGSALSDVVPTPKRYFFISGLFVSGISLAAIPLVQSYLAISVFCSVFGLASGINVGVTALVMTEMLGTERLMSSYGISLFMNGILQLIGPPICGFWFQYTHSYKSLFVTLGFILVAGAALWGLVPIINRRRAKKSKDLIERAY